MRYSMDWMRSVLAPALVCATTVSPFGAAAQIDVRDAVAHAHGVRADVVVVDDFGVVQFVFEFADLLLHLGLLVAGEIVLGVLRKVAEAASLFDLGRHFGAAGGFQIVEPLFQLLFGFGGQ